MGQYCYEQKCIVQRGIIIDTNKINCYAQNMLKYQKKRWPSLGRAKDSQIIVPCRRFTIEPDHRPLTPLFNIKHLDVLPPRVI